MTDDLPCSRARQHEGEGEAWRSQTTSSSSSSRFAFLFAPRPGATTTTTSAPVVAHSPAEGSGSGAAATTAPAAAGEAAPSPSSAPAPPSSAPAPPDAPATTPAPATEEKEDIWESSKPVERRSQALTDELHDCLGLFWSWVTCGGPGARVRQLYVNGKLSRCADEWMRLRTCVAIRATGGGENGGMEVTVNPGPHPVWRIRSRKEAGEFWRENYAHLGAGAVGGERKEVEREGGDGSERRE